LRGAFIALRQLPQRPFPQPNSKTGEVVSYLVLLLALTACTEMISPLAQPSALLPFVGSTVPPQFSCYHVVDADAECSMSLDLGKWEGEDGADNSGATDLTARFESFLSLPYLFLPPSLMHPFPSLCSTELGPMQPARFGPEGPSTTPRSRRRRV
jgi:hypothetical protein